MFYFLITIIISSIFFLYYEKRIGKSKSEFIYALFMASIGAITIILACYLIWTSKQKIVWPVLLFIIGCLDINNAKKIYCSAKHNDLT